MVIKNKETVCVVLVTFNRKKLLLECLEAIKKQTRPVDAIYIIDNASQDGTPELLKSEGFILKLPPFNLTEPYEIEHQVRNLIDGNLIRIYYVRMHENTGGAGGFHEGIKRGYEKGYDWLWVMDDDGLPEYDTLRILLEESLCLEFKGCLIMAKEQEGETAFYYPLPSKYGIKKQATRNARLIIESYPEKIIKHFLNPFNGCLIKRTVVSEVGLPLKELFVWGDEMNYFFRAVRCGIPIGTVVEARFWHPEDRQSVRIVNFGFRSVSLPYSDLPQKFYLLVRNRFYNSWLYESRVNAVARLLLYVFFFPTKVSLILRALFDAVRLLGQYKPEC